jgi:ketosteroid isomerase-like protein
VLLPPSGPPIETREAIEPIYRSMFERYELDLAVTFEEVGIGGDWAWCRGTTTGRMEPRAGAAAEVEPRDVHDKFLMILAPGPDGAWRITTLMWNPVPG